MASPTATIWMSIGAAAGTLVVVLGVIAGPSLLQCSSSPNGLLACMRQQVVDAGLLTAPETPLVPEPAPVAPLPQPTESPAPAPDLNLVRAEPDGSVIVAGSAAPGIEVEVFANGDLVGKAMVEASGDWVVVPDRPLAVGTAEISVGITGSNERSPRTFTVVIPADKVSSPVITPSDVAPDRAPVKETVPAPSAEPEPEPVAEASVPADVSPVPPKLPPAAKEAEHTPIRMEPPLAVAEADPATGPEPVVETQAPVERQPTPVGQPPAVAEADPAPVAPVDRPFVVAEAEPVDVPPAEPAATPAPDQPAPEPVPVAEPTAPVDVQPVQPEQSPATIEVDPAPVAPADRPLVVAEAEPDDVPRTEPAVTPVPAQPATIDAIEIDGSANYFAGAGPEGATVQLFVQDRFIASATVEGGRWLVEAEGVLNLRVQRVRIDLIRPEGTASARAEVNVVIDVPPPAPEIEASATATGATGPGATIAGELAIAPQVESELELDPAIPTLRAIPLADPAMLRFASGKAIIRRGETLWAIAARVYGDGSQYPRIVEANKAISSPGRIFPGQVFDLPKLDDPAPLN